MLIIRFLFVIYKALNWLEISTTWTHNKIQSIRISLHLKCFITQNNKLWLSIGMWFLEYSSLFVLYKSNSFKKYIQWRKINLVHKFLHQMYLQKLTLIAWDQWYIWCKSKGFFEVIRRGGIMITPKRTFDHIVEDHLKYLKSHSKKQVIIGRAKKVRKVGLCETAQNSDGISCLMSLLNKSIPIHT